MPLRIRLGPFTPERFVPFQDTSGMVLLQGYVLDDPATVAQIRFDPGEGVLAVQEPLILAHADKIRAGR
jgi:hypothetical protein